MSTLLAALAITAMSSVTFSNIKRAFDLYRAQRGVHRLKFNDNTVTIFRAPAVSVTVASMPFVALSLCSFIGYFWYFDELVGSPCELPSGTRFPANAWFSISAAIGDLPFTKHIWNYIVGLYCGARLLTGFLPYLVYGDELRRRGWSEIAVKGILVFHLLQQLTLMLLTVVSSKESLIVHQIGFGLFWISSIIYLCLKTWVTYDLSRYNRARYHQAYLNRLTFLIIHLVSSVLAIIAYFAHEAYCHDYLYTVFSMAEFAIVLSNISFHFVSEAEDFQNLFIEIKVAEQFPYAESND